MPNYYSPYNFYPATYPVMGGASFSPYVSNTPAMPQQSYTQPNPLKAMEWVEGEVGAKAFQMPPGWPANQPIPLWDSTETVIYLKSWSPGGFPNPMQKLRYEMPETQPQPMLQSGATSPEYVTKEDLKALREEIQSMRDSVMNRRNQNGSSNNGQQQNKGGNSNG